MLVARPVHSKVVFEWLVIKVAFPSVVDLQLINAWMELASVSPEYIKIFEC